MDLWTRELWTRGEHIDLLYDHVAISGGAPTGSVALILGTQRVECCTAPPARPPPTPTYCARFLCQVGAQVNETFQSFRGLDAASFPADIATYTGHYHRPHTVEGTNITYVGSPYQVGWGEAGQVKQLLVLGEEWEVLEKVPLALGVRHFHAATSSADEASVLGQQLQGLRPGDKVRDRERGKHGARQRVVR